ncbi:prolyl-tRNA synthetase [Thermanaeromonas toyohensis ToBE]|uniref:Proline--tRNA ligase n=1 Tax=Thermanaeromonas toyohensis ToBE TaxID=698762 RepID=A0A1W1VQJ0_9FIRM|nr:proline--tRNA ligase [Thermanaeromonas toyohensis]SMB95533.1 prolyl-tRNA synthetase [Thermanaeromonas toyohensis ToBE]
MRASQLFAPTLKETPAEAEVISHQLLLRAGFIRKAAAGIYTFLPLGWRVLKKIEGIVREEMDRAGAQELVLPILQPAEVWQESGRWDLYGEEMFRLKDRHGRPFCLGPTHEEIITALIRSEVNSYKQLPLLLYQIQNKYRDERRPRFGLLRGREFIMKDLYSFDRDEAGLEESYRKMYTAYSNVFRRCGLKFRAVEADTGAIGGNFSHEFMVLAETGEARVVFCPSCDYAANVEIAQSIPQPIETPEKELPLKKVATPGKRTVEDVCAYLGVIPQRLIKTLFYEADGQLVAALVRGDRELNEVKLQNALGCWKLKLAEPERVKEALGVSVGYVGPVGLNDIPIYADLEIPYLVNAVAGANVDDYHWVNVNPERDFVPAKVVDLREVGAGEPCPQCGQPLEGARGIEVGQIFKLGTKYSKALGATYLDETGRERPIVMGCYGIGISRTMAAAVEQYHDEKGIIWPISIAPYQVVVIPVSIKDPLLREEAEKLYEELKAEGVEAVLDDRDERAGVKFVEADLIGYPLRLTLGNKTLSQGTVDWKWRGSQEEQAVPREGLARRVKEAIQRALQELDSPSP